MKKGNLGEIATMKYFVSKGYNVYTPLTENSTYDIIVECDGKLLRVEVKSTSSINPDGKYRVELKSTRSNRTKNKILNFDNTKMDILAVYLEPIDEIRIFESKDILTKSQMLIQV